MTASIKKFAKGKDERIGWLNKIKENYNPMGLIEPGGLLENAPFVSSEGKSQFAELMDILRDVDGDVREEEVKSKNNIKAAKSSFNRKEYIACISYLGQYHDSLEIMMKSFSRLKSAVDMKHNEFLFSGVDPDALEYFKEKLPLKFQPKTAGLGDWWSNLTSTRGRGLVAWEKRFPKFAKKFKTETGKLLDKAESLQKTLTASLKTMASLRASRRLEEYLDVVRTIIIKYNEFDKLFQKYYDECVKQFVEQQSQIGQPSVPKTDPLADLTKKYNDKDLQSRLVEHGPENKMEPENLMKDPEAGDIAFPDKTISMPEDVFIGQEQINEALQDDLKDQSIEKIPTLQGTYSKPSIKIKPEDVSYQPKGRESLRQLINRPIISEEKERESTPIIMEPQSAAPFKPSPRVVQQLPAAPRVLVTPSSTGIPKLPASPKPEPIEGEFITHYPANDADDNYLAASQFLDKLTKLADQNPLILANEIIKYAKQLNNKATSDKLLAIAKNILK